MHRTSKQSSLTQRVGLWGRRTVRAAETTCGVGVVRLACGHVEAEMRPAEDVLLKMLRLLDGAKAGSLTPSRVEDEAYEYSLDNLTVVLPAVPKWE